MTKTRPKPIRKPRLLITTQDHAILTKMIGSVPTSAAAMLLEEELDRGVMVDETSGTRPFCRIGSWVGEAAAAPKHDEIQPGRVLLVDDEDIVRASTADMLSDLGFDVLEARPGEEALDVIAKNEPIDLLITDHMMPGITGADLAQIVQHRHPNMAILIVSGYADVVGLPPDLPRLEKPFRQSDLIAKLAAQSTRRLQMRAVS